MTSVTFEVRSRGSVVDRKSARVRRHNGGVWLSVIYKGRRYQLFGGITTPIYWIQLGFTSKEA